MFVRERLRDSRKLNKQRPFQTLIWHCFSSVERILRTA
jgi:hypothetical protein